MKVTSWSQLRDGDTVVDYNNFATRGAVTVVYNPETVKPVKYEIVWDDINGKRLQEYARKTLNDEVFQKEFNWVLVVDNDDTKQVNKKRKTITKDKIKELMAKAIRRYKRIHNDGNSWPDIDMIVNDIYETNI